MPSKIRILDTDTINKIAAGEVIENPASVVKELIENSLDAGATEISIEIHGGGRHLIRVIDNGCGMNEEDALLCLERHATSKLREIEELHEIGTMGFRGEAIPSIASISQLTLITRKSDCAISLGTMVVVEGGKILSCNQVECSFGTTIEVKSLFFNVPVRKKFQKSPSYDTAEIQKIVTHLALSHPKIHFRLISHQETLLSVVPQTKECFLEGMKERICQLLGNEFSNHLIPLTIEQNDFSLKGFIGMPSCSRHNRSGQYLFINHRSVMAPSVSFAIRDGYGPMLAKGRHPLFVVHLCLSNDLIDVNVHPQKKEVRLRQEQKLRQLIFSGVESALQQKNDSLLSSFSLSGCHNRFDFEHLDFARQSRIEALRSGTTMPFPAGKDEEEERFDEIVARPNIQNQSGCGIKPFSYYPEPPASNFSFFENSLASYDTELLPQPLLTQHEQTVTPSLFEWPHQKKQIPLQVLTTLPHYILALNQNEPSRFFIVDQRAAHSRVIYEQLLSEISESQEAQMLLIPHILNLASEDAAKLQEQLPLLQKAGIQIKEFSSHSFVVDGLPFFFGNLDIQKFMENILHNGPSQEFKRRLAMAASRAASKNRLEILEAQKLLERLASCQHSEDCPYGKKVFVALEASDLAKFFVKSQ